MELATTLSSTSSSQAPHRSPPRGLEGSFAPLLLLSGSNPLRWALIRFYNGRWRFHQKFFPLRGSMSPGCRRQVRGSPDPAYRGGSRPAPANTIQRRKKNVGGGKRGIASHASRASRWGSSFPGVPRSLTSLRTGFGMTKACSVLSFRTSYQTGEKSLFEKERFFFPFFHFLAKEKMGEERKR